MKKALLKTIYNFGGFAPFHRANRNKLLILTYHRFSREADAEGRISSGEFAAHLEYLKNRHRVLPLSEAIEYLRNEKTLPPNSVVITIDDGYRDAYEIAFPLLKKRGFPASLFVVTDFADKKRWLWTDLMRYVLLKTESDSAEIKFGENKIESVLTNRKQRSETAIRVNSHLKKLPEDEKESKIKEIAKSLAVEIPPLPTEEFAPIDWKQAREMDSENVKIESHTVTHPILTNVSEKNLNFELLGSKKRLEEVLNRKSENFCYPNGSLNENVWKAVEKAGYFCAVTTDYGFNAEIKNPFLLKRIDAQAAIENFAQSASGFEAARIKIKN